MAKHPSLVHAALQRLDAKMAIGESRHAVKREARKAHEGGQRVWTVSDHRMHAYQTRTSYQEHVLHFVNWVRQTTPIRRLEQLDVRADELASAYLSGRIAEGKSAYTLAAERSALRLFFDDATLAGDVALPRRRRLAITQNRGDPLAVPGFNPANWGREIAFLHATGLRRSEALHIRGRDVGLLHDGRLAVTVLQGKGGKYRLAPVLRGHEPAVEAVTASHRDDERLLPHLPERLRPHALRRRYAQDLYRELTGGRELPPAERTLRASDYDAAAAEQVSHALGHNRLDVVLDHYLR